jgi:hypothetical protein
MFVDNGGALWLSDPTVVILVLAGVVGLVYWCHRWLETGTMPTPRSMAIRQAGQHSRSRTLRQKIDARPALAVDARSSQVGRGSQIQMRTRRSGGYPQQAA